MKLTCIVPVYNGERTLSHALISIMLQTFQDWECIIVNDGSTDDTLDVIARFKETDKRFRSITITHGGISKARNAGMKAAKGVFCCFVDADDEITPERFRNAITAAEEMGVPIVQCGMLASSGRHVGFPKKGIYRIDDPRMFVESEFDIGHACNKLYRLDYIRGLNMSFDERCDYIEDWVFNTELVFRYGRIAYIDSYDYLYYVHPGSLCRSTVSQERAERIMAAFERQQQRLQGLVSPWQKYLMTHFIMHCILRHYKK